MSLVTVTGIENFVANIKRMYRSTFSSDNPDEHHDRFAAQLDGWPEVERGKTQDQPSVVERLEADERQLVADFVRGPDGLISYRVWEKR